MPAIIDLWNEDKKLPPRARIIAVARFFMGTPYNYGAKDARALDGVGGRPLRHIDCSGFVRSVFDEVFPSEGLACRTDLNALKLQTEDLFVDVSEPQGGDIICWDGHVGIVYDPRAQLFIGSQTSTGVMIASYKSGYWANTKTVKMFRQWKSL